VPSFHLLVRSSQIRASRLSKAKHVIIGVHPIAMVRRIPMLAIARCLDSLPYPVEEFCRVEAVPMLRQGKGERQDHDGVAFDP
jgi:hypothetical protein